MRRIFLRKNLLALSILTAAIVFTAAKGKDDDHDFKNLKVLPKNTTHEEMKKIMGHYKVALGVKCDFCHAKATDGSGHLDFASDDNKHKAIARQMMQMTADINGKYFNFGGDEQVEVVTCMTCHHGHKEPEDAVESEAHEDHKPEAPSNK